MKKQQPTQIKLLHRKFQFLTKNDITTIYEYLQEDHLKTEKILTIAKDIRNPHSIVKTLKERPEKGYSLLASFQRRYDQLYSNNKIQNIQRKQQGALLSGQKQGKFNFFNYIPKDVLLFICMYLDPYSLGYFSSTSKNINKISKSQPFELYYRNLCINIFQKSVQKMPQICRFHQVKNYVLNQKNLFGPNARHSVVNNLRYYVWKKSTIIQKKQASYMLSFGSYRRLFYNLPRLHYNGIYICKYKYRKEEQRNLINNTMEVYYITHYRYFRFFEDGTVLSVFLNNSNKQKIGYVVELLSKSSVQQYDMQVRGQGQGQGQQGNKFNMESNLMIGEYIQTGTNVEIKVSKQGAIFTYELELASQGSTSKQQRKQEITNTLIVKKYVMKVLDQKDIVQVLYQYQSNQTKEENQMQNVKEKDRNKLKDQKRMEFKYYFIPAVRKQNGYLISSSGL